MSAFLSLGEVGFGLVADTSSLDKSLEKLKAFGAEVDRVANSGKKMAATYAAAMLRQEQAAARSFNQIANLRAKAESVGASGGQFTKYSKMVENHVDVMTKGVVSNVKFARAQTSTSAIINEATRALKLQETQLKLTNQAKSAASAAQDRVAGLNSKITLGGGSATLITQNNQALAAYNASVSSGALTATKLADSQRVLRTSLAATTRTFQEQHQAMNVAERSYRTLQSATLRTDILNSRAAKVGVSPALISGNNTALSGLTTAMSSGTRREQVVALTALRGALSQTREAIHETTSHGSRLALMFRDMERATVLAYGPLSGFGARMAVMASLFETGSVKAAMMIAGFTGVVAVVGLMGKAAVETSMKFQQFDAMLVSSTGSATLVGEEMEYLTGLANKLGFHVQELVPVYARFATAARMTGMTLEDQRKITEAVIQTGAAQRMSTEQLGRAFLAFEQILSKGTVASEEVKKQLGDVLPGAVQIFAAALHMTSKAFLEAMKSGKLLAADVLPKVADHMLKISKLGAEAGAKTLAADLGRLATIWDNFLLSLDKTAAFSKLAAKGVNILSDSLKFLGENMEAILKTVGTLVGAAAGGLAFAGIAKGAPLATAALVRFGATVTRVGAAIAGVFTGRGLASLATFFIPGAGWMAGLAKVAALLGGAYLGYKAFSGGVEDTTEATKEYIATVRNEMLVYEDLAGVQEQTTKRIILATAGRIEAMALEIAAMKTLADKEEKPLTGEAFQKASTFDRLWSLIANDNGGKGSEIVQQMTAKTVEMYETQKLLNELMTRFGADSFKHINESGTEVGEDSLTKIQSFMDKLKDKIRELKNVQDILIATSKGPDELLKANGLAEAMDFMSNMPKGAPLGEMAAMMDKVGIHGANLVEQMQNLFAAIAKVKEVTDELTDTQKAQLDGLTSATTTYKELALEVERLAKEYAGLEMSKPLQDAEDAVTKYKDALIQAKLPLADVLAMTEQFRILADRKAGIELFKVAQQDSLKYAAEDSARLVESLSEARSVAEGVQTPMDAINKEWAKIQKMKVEHPAIVTDEVAQKHMLKFYDQLGFKIFTIDRVAEGMGDALVNAFEVGMKGGTSMTDVIYSLEMSIVSMITRLLVIEPIVASLVATMKGSGGFSSFMNNIFGNSIGGALGTAVGAMFGGGGGAEAFSPLTGSAYTPIGGPGVQLFATGGSFTVGGDGGMDTTPVNFLATKGEKVSITRPGEAAYETGNSNGGSVYMSFTINTPNADSFRLSQGQILSDASRQLSRARRNQ